MQHIDIRCGIVTVRSTMVHLLNKVCVHRNAIQLSFGGNLMGMSNRYQGITRRVNQQNGNDIVLTGSFCTHTPAFEAGSRVGNNIVAKAYSKNNGTDENGQPGHNRPEALESAQWCSPAFASLSELITDQAAQDIVRMRVGAIGNNCDNIKARWCEQSNRCAHRETVNDNLAGNRLRLTGGYFKRGFEIAYLGIATARHHTIAFAMSSKIEE